MRSAGSPKSIEDAIKEDIKRANKTRKNIRGAWIKEQDVAVDASGKITEFQVQMKVPFILDQ